MDPLKHWTAGTSPSDAQYRFCLPLAVPNGINHSPPTLNGAPSPPQRFSNGPSSSSSSSLTNQQLPATCGARQLSKLKRFLTTLQQFGNDISPEIGEKVRTLVLALVVSPARRPRPPCFCQTTLVMGSWQPAHAHVTQRYLFVSSQAEVLTEQDSVMFMLSGKFADFFFSCLWWVSKSCLSSGFDMSLCAAKLKETWKDLDKVFL